MTPPRDEGLRATLRAEAERQVSLAELDAYLRVPISDAERDDVLAQVRWFRTRYPTGADRLAYVRRAYRRWCQVK